jgi:CSLREA domain-containing protein
MRHSHPLPLLLLLALLVLAACGEDQSPTAPTSPAEPGGPAYSHTAGHKVVNSLADPGDGTCNAAQCTLREAIKDPQSTEISFKPGLSGTITLAAGGGTLRIDKNLSITGPSAGIVIRRQSTDPAFRIVRIGAGVSVKLTSLTLRNGKTDGTGGGLKNFGTLALTDCTVAGNSAALGGGGIDNQGQLTLTHGTVANNSTPRLGGGIYNSHGTLTLANSLVTGNSAGSGGGISTLQHSVTVANSLIRGNSAASGGGIESRLGMLTLTNTRIVDNSASTFTGGGIDNFGGTVTLTRSTVARNSAGAAGGIANVGRFTATQSTIADNSASREGGGIANYQGHRFTLENSTISGNSAAEGGGIFTVGSDEFNRDFTITSSTVARNRATQAGGGIHLSSSALLALTNSLIAQNTAPTGPDVNNSSGTPARARFNLIGNGSGSGITNTNGNQVGTASAPIDPKLGPLADNGGPTRTHALLLGSPAIDAASTPDCPTTDQRGVLRPQGTACDIGSYERK